MHTVESAQQVYVIIVRVPAPAQQSAKLSKPVFQRGRGPKRGRVSFDTLLGTFKSRVLCNSEIKQIWNWAETTPSSPSLLAKWGRVLNPAGSDGVGLSVRKSSQECKNIQLVRKIEFRMRCTSLAQGASKRLTKLKSHYDDQRRKSNMPSKRWKHHDS